MVDICKLKKFKLKMQGHVRGSESAGKSLVMCEIHHICGYATTEGCDMVGKNCNIKKTHFEELARIDKKREESVELELTTLKKEIVLATVLLKDASINLGWSVEDDVISLTKEIDEFAAMIDAKNY